MFIINLFIFMTMAFPKAGILLGGGISVTIAEVLFVLSILKCKKQIFIFFKQSSLWLKIYVMYTIVMLISVLINIKVASLFRIAVSIVLIVSPLAIGIGYKAKLKTVINILVISLIIVGGYAFIQWNFGIEKTAIPGVVIAYGDSFANKTIGNGIGGREAIKMPSTYQNGNGAGLFYIIGITSILSCEIKNKKIKLVAIIFGIIGILLSGSRSCLIPFVLFIPFVYNKIYTRLHKNGKICMIIMTIIIIITSINYISKSNSEFIKYFYERNIQMTITDKTGNGRVGQIKDMFDYIKQQSIFEKIRIIFFGTTWEENLIAEGVLYIFCKHGLLAMIFFCMLVLLPIIQIYKKYKIVAIGLLGGFVTFCVDSVFTLPPALMNYFFIIGVFINENNKEKGKINDENSNNNIRIFTGTSN